MRKQESLCGPTPWTSSLSVAVAVAVAVSSGGSGYLTSLSLCCCGLSKNLYRAVGSRSSASAIRVLNDSANLSISER